MALARGTSKVCCQADKPAGCARRHGVVSAGAAPVCDGSAVTDHHSDDAAQVSPVQVRADRRGPIFILLSRA